ncbi:NAD(P)-binding protein [Hyaloscypha variabilis]
MSKTLLITEATGNQGGAVIKALMSLSIPSPFSIVALTRNTNAQTSKNLLAKYPSINLIQGNLDDPEYIFSRAGAPVWGVFSVQNSMINGSSNEIEERQAKALHFVYASVDRHGSRSDTNPTNVPHFANKHRVEKYLQEKAAEAEGIMTWTILRPTRFMENFCSPPFGPAFMGKAFASVWRYALPVGVPLQLISVVDIGWFGAQAFWRCDSKEYRNRSISLAADELTFEEASKLSAEGYILR